jgi:hypothetical protein
MLENRAAEKKLKVFFLNAPVCAYWQVNWSMPSTKRFRR